MPAFDSSSIIYAWDNYPLALFPPLWNWLASEIGEKRVVFPSVVKEEVQRNAPDCSVWLGQCGPHYLEATQSILVDALRIKTLLAISEDRYGGGVGENDLIIIATARAHRLLLVTNEKRQNNPPAKASNRKIPAVCSMPEVAVDCQDFLEFLRQSNAVFRA